MILNVTPQYPPEIGGMQVFGYELAKRLQLNGICYRTLTTRPVTEKKAQEAYKFDENHPIKVDRALPPDNFFKRLHFLRDYASCHDTDAVYSSQIAYTPAFDDIAPVICRSAGNDILRAWEGPCDLSNGSMDHLSMEKQRVMRRKNRAWALYASRKCRAILCNSEWTKSQLHQKGFDNLHVVKGGVDINTFRPLVPYFRYIHIYESKELTLFIAARHVLKKGIDTAIEAIAKINNPSLHLYIAGIGPETRNLISMSHELEVDRQVTFIGPLSHEETAQWMAWSHIILMPSRNVYDPRKRAMDYETMGRTICEASACGVPVIASNCGGIPEMVKDGETGILVRPNDPDQLAEMIIHLSERRELIERMGSAGREYAVNELSFDIVYAKVMHFINEVTNARKENMGQGDALSPCPQSPEASLAANQSIPVFTKPDSPSD